MSGFRTFSLALAMGLCLIFANALASRAADAPEKNPEAPEKVLFLTLRGNPSTGHLWSWTASGKGAVSEKDIEYQQREDIPGAPVTYIYSFVGKKEGDVVLRFTYSQVDPPQQGDPVNVYSLKVLPDKRIVLLEMEEDIVGKLAPGEPRKEKRGSLSRHGTSTPGWWGAYADGEKKLSIGNYREGPAGMYFIATFSIGGVEQPNLTAPARGRNASCGGLLFNISEDDSVVTVTVGKNAEEAERQLIGRYVRE